MRSLGQFFLPWRKVDHSIVALIQREDGVGLAHLHVDPSGKQPQLRHCHFRPSVDPTARHAVVTQLVRQCGVEKCRFVGMLGHGAYTLFPADAPQVPRAEWAQNMRWKVGDRIDFPMEQAVVELFDLPGRNVGEESGKIYVVVAHQNVVQREVDLFLQAGLNLLSIDIPELALGRLTDGLQKEDQGVALLHFEAFSAMLIVRRYHRLYLARTIEVDLQKLLRSCTRKREPGTMALAEDSILDDLLAVLYRTFEFYESNFIQPSLDILYIVPFLSPFEDVSQAGGADQYLILLSQFSLHMEMSVRSLPLETMIQITPDIQPSDVIPCLPAIGAALGIAAGE